MKTIEERVALLEQDNQKTQTALLQVADSLDANAEAHEVITQLFERLQDDLESAQAHLNK